MVWAHHLVAATTLSGRFTLSRIWLAEGDLMVLWTLAQYWRPALFFSRGKKKKEKNVMPPVRWWLWWPRPPVCSHPNSCHSCSFVTLPLERSALEHWVIPHRFLSSWEPVTGRGESGRSRLHLGSLISEDRLFLLILKSKLSLWLGLVDSKIINI